MIWLSQLVNSAFFSTLHEQTYAGVGAPGGVSCEKFFFFAFPASAVWGTFASYVFQPLSYFPWVCWIAPDMMVHLHIYAGKIHLMFGYRSDPGMSIVTFDWLQACVFIRSPLVFPWRAEANIFAKFILFFWSLTPILYMRMLSRSHEK
ncbi:hypothetical protein FISHEDRAFT_33030 [Fistulina hepatica ATCC 64428]|uniref:Uncharacterized protein n=1 Tax=Fistulina hepatica ATCC 64428 TaxID=1128425 RepID=A0A0D7AP54_9AGAR|nr:hypothetical protein FISHEDRAFT_33030 [Fistulina hepatica ATCC 64428]